MVKKISGNLHIRGFISLLTALSFIIMTVSGIILFIVPQGRIANWHDWRFLALTKSQWGDMHISTSLLFIIAGLWHTWINWRALLGYFRNRQRQTLQLKPELVIATLTTVFFTVGATYKIPPVSYVLTLNETIKESWIRGPQDEPIISHAERLPFSEFVKKLDITLEDALSELKRQGLHIDTPNEKLADIARNNGTSPASISKRIEHLRKKQEMSHWSPALVEERFEGKGTGKRTLAEICKEQGLEAGEIIRKLSDNSIPAKPEETIKQIAERSGKLPMDILKLILSGEIIRS